MPTALELERLDAIVNRLLPLSNVQRGELIHAAAWNTVVEALIEVARAVLAETRPDTVPKHEHQDQVTLSWLDPHLRTLIQRGPLSDPITEGRLRETERRNKRFDMHFEEVQTDLRNLRQRLDEVITRDLTREATITRFDRRLADLPSTREEVLNLRGTLDTLRVDIQTVKTLSDNLNVDGEPVDMTAIVRRLETVEALRESLRTADGQLLDASQFEIKLKELSNEFVGHDELDEILSSRQIEIPPGLLDELRTQITDAVNEFQQARLEDALTAFQKSVQADINQRLSGIDALVAGAVANLEGTLRNTLLETLRTEVDKQIEAGMGAVQNKLSPRISALEERLAGLDIDQLLKVVDRLGAFEASLETIQKQMGTLESSLGRFEEQFSGIEKTVGSFSGRMGTLEEVVSAFGSRMSGLEEMVKSFDDRLAKLEERLKMMDGRLKNMQEMDQSFGRRLSVLESTTSGFDTRVKGLEKNFGGISGRIETLERKTIR